MFPHYIPHIQLSKMKEALLPFPVVRWKTEQVNGRELEIGSYMVAVPELWKHPYGIEVRGIVFDKETGQCIARPFEKFFNLGEKENTQPDVVQELMANNPFTVTQKRDGSMICPVLVGGKIYWKTKKSFYSDVIKDFLSSGIDIQAYNQSVLPILENGKTPIFEYTSPNSKIVIEYGNEPKLTLLAVRDIETGYYDYLDPNPKSEALIPYVEVKSVDELKSMQETVEGEEGWVVHIPAANLRVKVKTKWYLARHRCLDLRQRDVADAVVEERMDDIYPTVMEGGYDLTLIDKITTEVADDLLLIRRFGEELVDEIKSNHIQRKDIAEKYRGNSFVHLAFAMLDANDYNIEKRIIGLWKDGFREKWPLTPVIKWGIAQQEDEG